MRLLHVWCAAAFLNQPFIIQTVEEKLYIIGAFWMLFIEFPAQASVWHWLRPPNGGSARGIPHSSGWPVLLLGVNLSAFVMLVGGLCKLNDPLWRSGYGLYYTLLLPWIKAPSSAELLNWETGMLLMNHAAVLGESLVFVLFLFPATRGLALLFLAAFFGQLHYPIRLDNIGPLGLSMLLPLLGLLPTWQRPWRKLFRAPMPAQPSATPLSAAIAWLAGGLASLLALLIAVNVAFAVPWVLHYPSIVDKHSIRQTNGQPLPQPYPPLVGHRYYRTARQWYTRSPLYAFNQAYWKLDYAYLFTLDQTIGIYQYRIVALDQSGKQHEPLRVFNEDMSPNRSGQWLLTHRWLQSPMYTFGALARGLSQLDSAEVRKHAGLLQFRKVGAQVLHELPDSVRQDITHVQLLLRPALVPPAYHGWVQPWKDTPWQALCQWELATDSLHWRPNFQRHTFRVNVPGQSFYIER